MNNATATSLSHVARTLATVVDEGVAAGLPEPVAIFSAGYTTPYISARDFEDVEAWGRWLGTSAIVSPSISTPEVEFCEAETERDGVRFQVQTNRRKATS